MPILKIPVQAISQSGIRPDLFMAMCLEAKGAPVRVEGYNIVRTGRIIQQDDKTRKNIIFSWEDEK